SCTTIAVGKNASADGSTMCTHNADVRFNWNWMGVDGRVQNM
ncbi:unnamed protein product, partial [Ascophyllum nodosum]